MVLMEGLGDSLAQQILSPGAASRDPCYMEATVAAYTAAVEDVLGAPRNSLVLVKPETLKVWMVNS